MYYLQVAQQCKENIYAIQTLKDFQHLEENKDQGINVREKAKAVVALLKDDDRYYILIKYYKKYVLLFFGFAYALKRVLYLISTSSLIGIL